MAGADQMRQYTERYDALKAELQSLGFLFQGSLQTRRIGAHSRFPGHALTPTGVMAIRCKQFHLPDL